MGVSFTLRGLNTQLSLIRKAGYPIHVAQDICGSYYLNLDMSASLFDNIFWFKTTNPELTGAYGTVADTSDVAYYVDSNYWPDISYSHGLITNPDPGVAGARRDIDTFYVEPYLRFIGPAWLAKNITGGYNNSDLFENEDALQRQFVNFNGNFYKYVRFVFKSLVDASFGDPSGEYYTIDVSNASGYKRGFVGLEDVKFYENNTQIQISDISAITYSSIYGETYGEGSLLEASFNRLFDDSSGTFWISSEVNIHGQLLYEASDPSINDASYIELGVFSRKYLRNKSTPYILQLKNNDNQYVPQSISGEWLQFEFKENVSFTKIDFRPVGDHTPETDISFVGTIPRSIAILTSLDGTNWEVLNDYDNLKYKINDNPFADSSHYDSLRFPNIKREITGVLDASGGSASNPLSNADTGFNNISRDILKNMLDSDDPATVQRVHTMIENSKSALSYELDLLPHANGSAGSHTAEIYEIDICDNRIFHIVVNLNNSDDSNHTHGKLNIDGTRRTREVSTSDDLGDGEIITWWNYSQNKIRYGKGSNSIFKTLDDPFWDTFTITLEIIENGTKYKISNSELNTFFNDGDAKVLDIPNRSNKVYLYLSLGLGGAGGAGGSYEIIPGGIPSKEAVKITSPAPGKTTISYLKEPLYIGMFDPWIPIEFQAGDKMEFSLTYGTSDITDSSNVALNSSGNRLGSNVVEDQDYYVRIHMK